MSFLKTTIKVESTGIFPSAISTSKVKSTQLDGSNVGHTTLTTSILPISQEQCGPKGAIVYLSAPSTNTEIIKIWDAAHAEQTVPVSYMTLKPGDTTIYNLTHSQGTVYASTVNGTADLDYIIGDKGGVYGNSQLYYTDALGDYDWKFCVTDAQTGETTPLVKIGLNSDDGWSRQNQYYIQGKGYVIRFYNGGSEQHAFAFINSKGQLVDLKIVGYYNLYDNYNMSDNKVFWFVTDINSAYAKITVFDGDSIFEHQIPNTVDWDLEYSGNQTSADGALLFYAYGYLGQSVDAVLLINGATFKVLDSMVQYSSSHNYDNAYLYNFSNFVIVTRYDDDNGKFLWFRIFDTQGTILKTVSLDGLSGNITYFDEYFYGDGKVQIIAGNGGDSNIPYYLFNYDESTNILLGETRDWQINRNTYSDYRVISKPKTFYYENDYDNSKDPQSVAVLFFTQDDGSFTFTDMHLSNGKLVTVINGDLGYYEYSFDNCWVPSILLDDSNSPLVTDGGIVFPYNGINGDASGIRLKFIISGNKSSDVQLTQSTTVNYSYNEYSKKIRLAGFGDYWMVTYYDIANAVTYFKVYSKDGILLDTLPVQGTAGHTYPGFWRVQYNCLLIRTWDGQTVSWFFNTRTKKFVQTPFFIYAKDYGYQYAYLNGVNPGVMALYGYDSVNQVYKTKVLNQTGLTSNSITENHYSDWDQLTGDKVYHWYIPNQSDPISVDILDLSLTVIKTVTLDMVEWGWNNYSNKFFVLNTNDGPNRLQTLVTEDSVEKIQLPNYGSSYFLVNDVVFD